MSMTAKQAKKMSIVIPGLCVGVSLLIAITPFVSIARQQAGERERNRQMIAIAKDSIADRCFKFPKGTPGKLVKGTIVPGPTPQTLSASCIQLNDSWGFMAVQDGEVKIIQTYTDKEINATKSQINLIQGN